MDRRAHAGGSGRTGGWRLARALKALDDARLSGEIELGVGVRIDVGCCDEMLYCALAAGCCYDEDEVLPYTAAVASPETPR